jgi:hypothetical protein
MDATGSFVWVRQLAGTGTERANGIAADSAGNTYVAGTYSDAAAFGSVTLSSAGYADLFVAKFNSSGVYQWSATGGGISSEQCDGIALDGSGNAYIVGKFASPATFGSTTLTASGSTDLFLARVSSTGSFTWATMAGGDGNGDPSAIAVGSQGIPHVTGLFNDTTAGIFGNTTLLSSGSRDVFVWKHKP